MPLSGFLTCFKPDTEFRQPGCLKDVIKHSPHFTLDNQLKISLPRQDLCHSYTQVLHYSDIT